MTCPRATLRLVLGAVALSSLLLGCTKSEGRAPSSSSPLTATTRASIDEAISSYDGIREALAGDRDDVKSQALALASAAKTASASAPESLGPSLDDLAASAQRLGALDRQDLAQARKLFGDVSRALIAVLSAEPSLQPGRHVYECPMAKGYKKWVQLDDAISNPYMGREMPKCGSEAEF